MLGVGTLAHVVVGRGDAGGLNDDGGVVGGRRVGGGRRLPSR